MAKKKKKKSEQSWLDNNRNLINFLYLVRFPLFNKNKPWSKEVLEQCLRGLWTD